MKKIIFVCLGNICRSPAAEAIFISKVKLDPFFEDLEIESGGTSTAHTGEFADFRMREHASKRGYKLEKKARRFTEDDLIQYDYILAMDQSNVDHIIKMDKYADLSKKLFLMTSFCSKYEGSDIPDPYYGEKEGFDNVLDILEEAVDGFRLKIKNEC